jgi:uncharacterized protein
MLNNKQVLGNVPCHNRRMKNNELTMWRPRLVAMALAAADDDGAHDINHLHRVWRNAQALLATYPQADALVVMAACYLHDLVNLPKDHHDRRMASRHSAMAASAHLSEAGFPADRLPEVAHAIETHSFSAGLTPRTIEAKIVQDADRLDGLGAVGLARMFYIAGQMRTGLAHPDDPAGASRELDDRQFALDHIGVKLAKLPGMMQTGAGRVLGEQRLAHLLQFRDDFASEWAAPAL